jgi:hypothetical protein
MELARFTADYKLVKETMARIGVSRDVVDAITIEEDGD